MKGGQPPPLAPEEEAACPPLSWALHMGLRSVTWTAPEQLSRCFRAWGSGCPQGGSPSESGLFGEVAG